MNARKAESQITAIINRLLTGLVILGFTVIGIHQVQAFLWPSNAAVRNDSEASTTVEISDEEYAKIMLQVEEQERQNSANAQLDELTQLGQQVLDWLHSSLTLLIDANFENKIKNSTQLF